MESSQFQRDILKSFKLFALLLLKNFTVDSSKFGAGKVACYLFAFALESFDNKNFRCQGLLWVKSSGWKLTEDFVIYRHRNQEKLSPSPHLPKEI